MSKKTIIISLIMAIIIIITTFVIVINLKQINIGILVKDVHENNYTTHQNDTLIFKDIEDNYYLIKNDGLYLFTSENLSFTKRIIAIEGIKFAQKYDENIILSDKNSIYLYDSSYNLINVKQFNGNIENIVLINSCLYIKCSLLDPDVKILQLTLPGLEIVKDLDTPNLANFNYMFHNIRDFQIIYNNENGNMYYPIAICKDFSYVMGFTPFMCIYNNHVYQLRRINYTDYELESNNATEYFQAPQVKSPERNILLSNNLLLVIGVQSGMGNESYSSKLRTHQFDTLTVYDMKTTESYNYKTKKGERIIYTDCYKTITYYNNKYITYYTSNFHLVKEMATDKIVDNENYIFTVCGEYIWIFDSTSKEYIERILIQ